MVPIITMNSPKKVEMMKWGLIPHWAKDPKIGYKMINARAETVAEKPSFRNAFKKHRCLVPASGFYEWKRTDGKKQPYFIHEKKEPIFAMAGLFEIWNNPVGEEIRTFTIITTEANSLMAKIHDRMPVILDEKNEDTWLQGEMEDIKKLLKPISSSGMESYKVSTAINSGKIDIKDLIKNN